MSAGVKYSIPNNYVVQEFNGLKGLIRRDKKGDKWLWEPTYKHLLVSKTFGKILVCYQSAMSGEDFSRISDYKGDTALQVKVYDILFGENCLYIKTIRPKNGEPEWCMVNEDFNGGLFLGDFEILRRNPSMPFHIPVGTERIPIKVGDEEKLLVLHTGEIEDLQSHAVEPQKPPEEVVTEYTVFINTEVGCIQLLHPTKSTMLKQSTSVGELEAYSDIITAMLGGLEHVPKDRAEKLVKFLDEIEYYGNAMALPILFEYVKARTGGDTDTILAGMLKELDSGWKQMGKDFKVKIYASGSIIMPLIKNSSDKIIVAPYIIRGEDNMFEINEIEALTGAYKETKVKTVRLDTKDVELSETVSNEDETSKWQSPYPVRQRPAVASDVKDFKYKKIDIYYLSNDVIGADGKNYGDIGVSIALCDTFIYRSKKRIGGKVGEWITTNTCAAQVV